MKKEKKIELKGALKVLGIIVLLGMVCVGSAMGYATISADDFHWSVGDVVFNSTGLFINSTNVVDINAGQAATFIVATSDSLHPERADYVCDGVDDQVQIHAAIGALPSGGGTIYLLEGSYDIETIEIYNKTGVHLCGAGKGTKLIANSNGSIIIVGKKQGAGGSQDITIEDMYFDGTSQTTQIIAPYDQVESIGHAIDIGQESDNIIVRNCHIYNTGSDSIHGYFTGTDNLIIIENNIVENARAYYAAIHVHMGYEWIIKNNIIKNSSCGGIRHGHMIQNNYIDGTGKVTNGEGIIPSSWGSTVTGNWLKNIGKCGIYVWSSKQTIVGNHIEIAENALAPGCGIDISALSHHRLITDCIISNNFIGPSWGSAIRSGSDTQLIRGIITGNTLYAASQEADGNSPCIGLLNTSKTLIANNIIYSNTTNKPHSGIRLFSDSDSNSVIGNFVEDYTTYAIEDEGTNNIIQSNYGYNTKNSGSSTGTGAQQSIPHGLAATPTKVVLWNIEDGANPYQSASANATNIYVLAVVNQDYGWEAEVA